MLVKLKTVLDRLQQLLQQYPSLPLSQQQANAVVIAEYDALKQISITPSQLIALSNLSNQTIKKYHLQQKRLGFHWRTAFYDLLGFNQDLLLTDVFNALLIELIKQWFYSVCLDSFAVNETHSLHTDIIEAQIGEAATLLYKAQNSGKKAKLLYRLSWVSYIIVAIITFIICHMYWFTAQDYSATCRLLHIGPVDYVITLGAGIGWLAWLIFAGPYYLYRHQGFKQEKAALTFLTIQVNKESV